MARYVHGRVYVCRVGLGCVGWDRRGERLVLSSKISPFPTQSTFAPLPPPSPPLPPATSSTSTSTNLVHAVEAVLAHHRGALFNYLSLPRSLSCQRVGQCHCRTLPLHHNLGINVAVHESAGIVVVAAGLASRPAAVFAAAAGWEGLVVVVAAVLVGGTGASRPASRPAAAGTTAQAAAAARAAACGGRHGGRPGRRSGCDSSHSLGKFLCVLFLLPVQVVVFLFTPPSRHRRGKGR